MLLIRDGKVAIVVNKRHAESRRRFTIRHEIGNLKLHALLRPV